MNLASERNKPIFVVRPQRIAFANEGVIIEELVAKSGAIHAERTDDFLIKASSAGRLSRGSLVPVNEASPSEIRDLVVARLEADRDEKFEFVDGRTFSGAEAAKEVRADSRIGKYFTELEKETLRIVQEAFFKNQLG